MGPPNWHLSVYLPVNRTKIDQWLPQSHTHNTSLPYLLIKWEMHVALMNPALQTKKQQLKPYTTKVSAKSFLQLFVLGLCAVWKLSWAIERWRCRHTHNTTQHNAAFSSVFQPLGFVAVVQLFACLCVGHTLVPSLRHLVRRPRRWR